MATFIGPNGNPVFKDTNAILYELITSLSTFQEHNERQGPDPTRDDRFADRVIETAKKLTEMKKELPHLKDPEVSWTWGCTEYTITLFRKTGPMVYKFNRQPVIASTKFDGGPYYMRSATRNTEPEPEKIPLTDKEADILRDKIYEFAH
jgi:hypothetical protein